MLSKNVQTTRLNEDACINYFQQLHATETEAKQKSLQNESIRIIINIGREEI